MTQRWYHPIQYRAEALVARAALALLRRLGPVRGSNLAGAVGRAIGPLLPVSRVADINLRLAMPELDAPARRRVIRGVWENLGRTVAELPHVATLGPTAEGPGWEVVGGEILHKCRDAGGTMILFSGHIGCWEVLPALLGQNGMPMASFYRAAGNPEVDTLINAMRRKAVGTDVPFFNKSARGAREAMLYLAQGGRVGMLVDQKMNEGIETRLFGQPVMTTTSPAAFALRFQCPMIPGHTVRIGPCRFKIVVEPSLPLPDSGDHHADILALTQTMNDCLERWIREWPEGWLWLHRRFPMEVYGR